MELEPVTEGSTTFQVPAGRQAPRRGPASAGPGFYNPAMALTRDVGVVLCRALEPSGEPTFLDGLAAAGARGLRMAYEAGWSVTLNDRTPKAVELARRNAKALDLPVRIEQEDLNALLTRDKWWHIDVDPYGSPVPFLGMAVRAVAPGGVLCISATDTTALHGVRQAVTRRRYLARGPPKDAPGWKAAAARLLVGYAVRAAARFDRALTPLFAFEQQHAFRAAFRVRTGAGRADAALEQVDEVVLCTACQTWGPERCACGKGAASGPYWMGPLHDAALVSRMRGHVDDGLARPGEVDHLLEVMEREAGLGPFYLHVPEASSALGVQPPGRARLIQALEDAGLPAGRTVFSPEAVAYRGDPSRALAVMQGLEQDEGRA